MKDIRSFFGTASTAPKKKSSKAKNEEKRNTESSVSSKEKTKNEIVSKTKTRTVQQKTTQTQTKKRVSRRKIDSNKNKVNEEIDDEKEDDEIDVGIVSNNKRKVNNGNSSRGKKNKVLVIESSSESEGEEYDDKKDDHSSQDEKETKKRKFTRKKIVIEDSDDDDDDDATTDEEFSLTKKASITTKPKNEQNNKDLDSTSSTRNDINDDKAISTSSKSIKSTKDYTKSVVRKKEESKEISAEDYFSSAVTKSTSTTKKTKILKMEEEEEDVNNIDTMECDDDADDNENDKSPDVVKSKAVVTEEENTSDKKMKEENADEGDPVTKPKTSVKQESSSKASNKSKDALTFTLLQSKPTKSEEVEENVKKEDTSSKPIPVVKKSSTKSSKKSKKSPPIKPKRTSPPVSDTSLSSLCLTNQTFVFTGVLPNISRDDAMSLIKILGGRVTTTVSSKTTYLVCGDVLEDGRDVIAGMKFKKASELGEESVVILRGEGEFYGLLVTLSDLNKEDVDLNKEDVDLPVTKPTTTTRVVRNPYAKKKTATIKIQQEDKQLPNVSSSSSSTSSFNPHQNDLHALWADKYAPTTTSHILGNGDSVKKLSAWLRSWESTHNKNNNSKQRTFKAALLSGPPGIGKTTTAMLVSKENNRIVREFNASDVRSKKMLLHSLGDITGSQTLFLGSNSNSSKSKQKQQQQQKRVIIMDEVDGMSSGDRSGISEIISMIKTTLVPIICICNDRQSQKLKSLIPYCLDLRYRRPVKSVIARRALEIASSESMTVEYNAIEALSESCGNDIRQVLNCMQMWSNTNNSKKKSMTFKDFKDRENLIKKDDILRLNMFDATKMILEGKNTLYKRSDAFFTDYNFMGISIQENYLKAMICQYQETKKNNDTEAELKVLERMSDACDTMSNYAMAEQAIRGGDQNWELLPFCAMLAVKTGRHAAGEQGTFFAGYPAFPSWLGKNSSRGKKQRILAELSHHMNYNISTDQRDLRCHYIPTFYTKFMNLFSSNNITELISLMDEYGLDRDDIFENINEFTSLVGSTKSFSDFDSKLKASFTREYNKGSHMSQALVEEQGAGKKAVKRKASSTSKELDVVDDDEVVDDEEDDIKEDEDVKAFLKKGARSGSRGAKGSLSSVESGKTKRGKRPRKK